MANIHEIFGIRRDEELRIFMRWLQALKASSRKYRLKKRLQADNAARKDNHLKTISKNNNKNLIHV